MAAEWLVNMVKNTQAQHDAKYADEVQQYISAGKSWQDAVLFALQNNQPIPSFTKPKPTKWLFSVNDTQTGMVQTPIDDPSVKEPEMPTYTAPDEVQAMANLNPSAGTDMLQAILNKLERMAPGV